MASPLVGAWELESDTHQGLFICTETHYCNAFMEKNRNTFKDEISPTDAEAAEAYRTLAAGAGTYSVSGSIATLSEDTNRNPNGIGRPASLEFTVEGDRMTTIRQRRGEALTDHWRKVG